MRVNEEGGPLRPERVEVVPPGPGRVRVDVVACGVCGADLRTARGVGAALPATPGHEVAAIPRGSGEVEGGAVRCRVVLDAHGPR